MTELRIPEIWKERIISWLRDLIIVFGMWSIWLISVYMDYVKYKYIVMTFIGIIIGIIILLGEHYRAVDYKIREYEREYKRLKKIN